MSAVSFAPPAGYAGPRRSLVLSGGGMRLSYQAGVLRALQEAGLVFSHVDATSGGAMNAAMLLSGLTPHQMADRWRTLDLKKTISLMPLHSYLTKRDAVAMASADAFKRYAYPHLGIDLARVRASDRFLFVRIATVRTVRDPAGGCDTEAAQSEERGGRMAGRGARGARAHAGRARAARRQELRAAVARRRCRTPAGPSS